MKRSPSCAPAPPTSKEAFSRSRSPSPELLALASYISEIHAVRHPYESGLAARRGIEF
ncbi:MAG: cob(I)yrinic acid a,c-diamide adenosyltransferase [Oscillospiraceae bacterium]